jgi:hypothetical protein
MMIMADVQASAGSTGAPQATESAANDCNLYLLALKAAPEGASNVLFYYKA